MVAEDTLPEAFRRGLQAIRDREVPDAKVLAVEGNFAYIDLGMEQLMEPIAEPEARLVVRAPLAFPNAQPYGFVTIPFLRRTDGAPIERQHRDHPTAGPVKAALGTNGSGFWSWNWSNMPARRPEDLAAIVEWARKRIREA